jgi:hypothetical protein
MIKASAINAADFGAVGDGTTDDTAAIQAAVDYCIANSCDLVVNSMYLLTDSINIDRPVDNINFSEYFTIFSQNGGGFLVNTAIPMFSSTIPFSTVPVVQLVKFQNLNFVSSNTALDAYVLDDARFLRTVFNSCTFFRIKCLYAPTVYTQSIYFMGGQGRFITGTFFRSLNVTYDLKVEQFLLEGTPGGGFELGLCAGCSFIGCNIEGMFNGFAIKAQGNALNITGCYFEYCLNALDFGAGTQLGFSLIGNYFGPTSTGLANVLWYNCINSVSYGNYFAGSNDAHNFGIGDRTPTLNDYSPTGPIANFDPISIVSAPLTVKSLVSGLNGATLESINGKRYSAQFYKIVSVNTNLLRISLGVEAACAIIDMTVSGIQPTIDVVAQMNRWVVIKNATTTTITAVNSYNNGGLTPVIASVSGNDVILSLVYAGVGSNVINGVVNVLVAAGTNSAQQTSILVL